MSQPIGGIIVGGALTVAEALGQRGMIPLLSYDRKLCQTRLFTTEGEEEIGRETFKA